MNFVSKSLAGAALAGLVLTQPIAAQAAPARVPAATEQAERLHGGVGPAITIIGVFAALALLLWAVGVFDDGNVPTSP